MGMITVTNYGYLKHSEKIECLWKTMLPIVVHVACRVFSLSDCVKQNLQVFCNSNCAYRRVN